MQKNITQNLDANLAVARINVTAIAHGMKQGFDVARICFAEPLHRLLMSTRSAFAQWPAMSSLRMIQSGTEPDGRSGSGYGRNLECCYLDKPGVAISTSPTSTAIKPLKASALKARPWRSQTPKRVGMIQAMVQSLVIS